MPPPTPNLDAVFKELGAYFDWWMAGPFWRGALVYCLSMVLTWAFVGGIRGFFLPKPDSTEKRREAERLERLKIQ